MSAVAAAWLLCAVGAIAAAQDVECPGIEVSIRSDIQVGAGLICDGAGDALTFFAGLGLAPTRRVLVEVVRELPEAVSHSAVGCYLDSGQRPMVIPRAAFLRRENWFGVPIDDAMYRSLVAHEVAHAVAACHFTPAHPTIQAQEYVAYVAMFASMDAGLRRRILEADAVPAFDSETKINTTVYLCDPMRFALRAYRHYLQDGHGDRFLRQVLAGQALAD